MRGVGGGAGRAMRRESDGAGLLFLLGLQGRFNESAKGSDGGPIYS